MNAKTDLRPRPVPSLWDMDMTLSARRCAVVIRAETLDGYASRRWKLMDFFSERLDGHVLEPLPSVLAMHGVA